MMKVLIKLLIILVFFVNAIGYKAYAKNIDEIKSSMSNNSNIQNLDTKEDKAAGIVLSVEEVKGNILNDLISELRPYLKEIIEENVDDAHVFSTTEVLGMIATHPIKFLTALYNYIVNSIKEIFDFAALNAEIVTE